MSMQGPGHTTAQPATVDGTDRTMAVLAHLSAVIALVISAGSLPFLGPLVIWLIYRDSNAFVRQAAAGSFNFNLGMTIMSLIGWVLIITVIGLPVGIVLVAVASILSVVLSVIAALKARNGELYNYPFQFKILS